MPVYKAPVEDVLFLLNDVFQIEKHNNLPGFADATADTIEAILGGVGASARRCSRRSTLSGIARAARTTPMVA